MAWAERTRAPSARATQTISACSRAILLHYGIDPVQLADRPAAMPRNEILIRDMRAADDHLTMTILLPMPYGAARMTIATAGEASVTLPGMTLSPAIAAAAIGRPVGRLAGHPAFDALADLLVTQVAHAPDAGGHGATILHFADYAEPLGRIVHLRVPTLQ